MCVEGRGACVCVEGRGVCTNYVCCEVVCAWCMYGVCLCVCEYVGHSLILGSLL